MRGRRGLLARELRANGLISRLDVLPAKPHFQGERKKGDSEKEDGGSPQGSGREEAGFPKGPAETEAQDAGESQAEAQAQARAPEGVALQ